MGVDGEGRRCRGLRYHTKRREYHKSTIVDSSPVVGGFSWWGGSVTSDRLPVVKRNYGPMTEQKGRVFIKNGSFLSFIPRENIPSVITTTL